MEAYDPNTVAYVRMEFIGTRSGAVTYPGLRGSGRTYRAGRNPTNRFHNVHPGDVTTLENTGEFRRTAPAVVEHDPTPPTSQPAPAVAVEPSPVVEMPVGGSELETVAEVAPVVAPEPVLEQVIQDASGPIVRKRGGPKKTNSRKTARLKDLPPLG